MLLHVLLLTTLYYVLSDMADEDFNPVNAESSSEEEEEEELPPQRE